MSIYAIVSYDIVDPESYKNYVPGVLPLLEKHGGKIIVADYDAKPLEGDRHSVYVILEFASEKEALAWYNDPAYAPVKKIRTGSCTNGNMVLAKPFAAQAAKT